MDTEELRVKIVDGLSEAMDNKWVRRFVSADRLKLMLAQKVYWQTAPTTELQDVLDKMAQLAEPEQGLE